jgi:hypothetical protein
MQNETSKLPWSLVHDICVCVLCYCAYVDVNVVVMCAFPARLMCPYFPSGLDQHLVEPLFRSSPRSINFHGSGLPLVMQVSLATATCAIS